ncbi:glutathione peroxidase [Vibrio sagamiensis]|uniref:Glutathione peroxidase n=1 Tax=Vibrio sagamiensis NBRC 104589 TaxID=1219064 RepID=A0A511QC08_9VIBR|nr:redoxin family protein [Vibrio sagamiensis]PNQ54374.1 glutathione peroxidase [Vibrio agarivorans]GEM74829.1 glutathione peroxidase [Vibrio sagamiensis NBRC 104589]
MVRTSFLSIFALAIFLQPYSFAANCPELLNVEQRLLNSNKTINLCDEFKGKTLLVVNTASQCGYTSQFKELEQLYQTYKDKGFAVIGFPSNDFHQDRGSEQQTANICYLDYGVTFPMMARTSLSGSQANPVFTSIMQQANVTPKWNFYKYLIDKHGQVVAIFPSSTSPTGQSITHAVEQQL